MPYWVSLKELMEKPSKYGVEDPRLFEIAYTPDKRSITLTPDMTGYDKAQTFETEIEGHKYYPIMHEGKLYLVSSKVTKRELILNGRTGYDNGPEALRKQSQVWRNEELGAKGETWNEETIGILDRLPEFLRKIKETYWKATQWSNDCYFGLQGVHSSGVGYRILYGYNSGSASNYSYSYAVRPLVSLISNIQVDIEKLEGMPLRLRLPKKQAKEKEAQLEKIAKEDTSALIEKLKSNILEMSRHIQQLTAQMEETAQLIEQIEHQNLT